MAWALQHGWCNAILVGPKCIILKSKCKYLSFLYKILHLKMVLFAMGREHYLVLNILSSSVASQQIVDDARSHKLFILNSRDACYEGAFSPKKMQQWPVRDGFLIAQALKF